ncbi:MAG: ABC transporter ATP-binding protein, partial [Acetobacteraceae bacterium]
TPARQLAKTGRIFGRGAVALERVGDYLREAPGIVDPPGASAPEHCAGVVAFQAVRFGYRPDRPVLHGIDLVLTPGRTIALVGATGSGKSTIAALIPRFFDPQGGRILLDGRDLASLPLSWLRRQIALVTQEPLLFQATVWENIAYGREGAGRAEAMRAAEAIGIGPIIADLPEGFDTPLRERGLGLSGGQRQCIALARAMLRDAPVVILDEPTASLDPETEARLTDALHRLTARRAALVIAHRLGTVTRADTILVLSQGRIVQQGTHQELLAEGGAYSVLWRSLRREERRDTLRLVVP